MNTILLNSYMPVRIISGRDCVLRNKMLWKSAGKKALLVTGKTGARQCGALQDVCAALDECGTEYEIFDSVRQNPLVSDCYAAACVARRVHADFIVGIGGGSAQDAAKAVAIFAADEALDERTIYTRTVPSARLPLYLVGTTAGTGSEVTGVSVLTDVNGFKKSISGADCYAVAAFCDAKYSYTANYDVTVSTALDAYAHALESFFAETANDLSEKYALAALQLLWKNLQSLSENKNVCPSEANREELYAASLYAGLAINITGTAFPHTAGYILTELFAVSHGKACTAFHPQLLDRAEKYRPEKLGTVCKLFATDKNGINTLIASLTDVRISITEAQAEEYCSRWVGAVRNFDRTPGGYTPQDAVQGLLALR